jgi:hypothetical protein
VFTSRWNSGHRAFPARTAVVTSSSAQNAQNVVAAPALGNTAASAAGLRH